jgi:hypothetical protein
MQKYFLAFVFACTTSIVSAQFVARLEIKESIPGICDEKEVYAMFPIKGQEEAVCPVKEEQIITRLNSEVQYLRDNPKHDDKAMIGLIINCKGELVQCKMDRKTKKSELDKQIEAVFNSLGEWKAGKLDGKEVDTSKLYSFKIKNGKVSFD